MLMVFIMFLTRITFLLLNVIEIVNDVYGDPLRSPQLGVSADRIRRMVKVNRADECIKSLTKPLLQ